MAKENIARFIKATMTDKALAAKVAALATEHGYGFTATELLAAGDKADSPTAVQSLSDTDMGAVSGGRVYGDGPKF